MVFSNSKEFCERIREDERREENDGEVMGSKPKESVPKVFACAGSECFERS
jgi:hypothetical protein